MSDISSPPETTMSSVIPPSASLPSPQPLPPETNLPPANQPEPTQKAPISKNERTIRATLLQESQTKVMEIFSTHAVSAFERTEILHGLLQEISAQFKFKDLRRAWLKLTENQGKYPVWKTIYIDLRSYILLRSSEFAGEPVFHLAREIAVANIPEEKKSTLLQEAWKEKWKRKELRAKIRELRPPKPSKNAEAQLQEAIEKIARVTGKIQELLTTDPGLLQALPSVLAGLRSCVGELLRISLPSPAYFHTSQPPDTQTSPSLSPSADSPELSYSVDAEHQSVSSEY